MCSLKNLAKFNLARGLLIAFHAKVSQLLTKTVLKFVLTFRKYSEYHPSWQRQCGIGNHRNIQVGFVVLKLVRIFVIKELLSLSTIKQFISTLYNVDAVVPISQTMYHTTLHCTPLIHTTLKKYVVWIHGFAHHWEKLEKSELYNVCIIHYWFVQHWKVMLYYTMVYNTILAEILYC